MQEAAGGKGKHVKGRMLTKKMKKSEGGKNTKECLITEESDNIYILIQIKRDN